jgi:ABC-type lipoprotein release transport system permease subunit
LQSDVSSSQLYGVRPIDPLTLLASCAALGAAAMFATWWPVHRAASGNPLEALREE